MTFTEQVRRFRDRADARARQAHALASGQNVRSVVGLNPVDTGRSMANWEASLHAPYPGAPDVYRFDPVGAATVARLLAVVDQSFGKRLYLSNAIDYFPDLEYGSSRKAPQGMIRISAVEWPEMVHAAVRQTR